MAKELIKKSVDGSEYEFEQFGAKQSVKVFAQLSKFLGKPLLLATSASKGAGKHKSLDMSVLAEAAQALFSSMDQDEVVQLLELLCAEKALCDGKKIKFDEHYAGRMSHLFRVASAALEVQYGNFLEELLESLGSGKVPASTQELPTSI